MCDSSVTSAAASCAPPPATISTRAAPPRRFAASRTASSSIAGSGAGSGGAIAGMIADLGALRPHTSIAHSSTAGPGRPLRMARLAAWTSGAASAVVMRSMVLLVRVRLVGVASYRTRGCLSCLLQGFPDDYLATYDARLRAYARAPSAAGLAADCVIRTPDEIARCE